MSNTVTISEDAVTVTVGVTGPQGATGTTGAQGATGNSEVSVSFNADGDAYYQPAIACTLAAPATRGDGTFAYEYASDGATFVSQSAWPLAMDADSVLKITLSGVTEWATVAFVRTT